VIAVPSIARPDRHALDRDFKVLFGLQPKAKWPAAGMARITVATTGVMLWVKPLTPTSRQGVPRLMARCPGCGRDFGGGKIQQHYQTHW
jgi:hypothetical protein